MPFDNGYSWGWYLVSLLGLPMLASLVTGLVVYKRFWKGFFRPRLRISQGARIFWGDFHRLSGIWSILVHRRDLHHRHLVPDPGDPRRQSHHSLQRRPAAGHRPQRGAASPSGQPAVQIDLDEAVRIATRDISGLEASGLFLPGNAYSPLYVYGRGWYPLMYQSAAINPYNGRIESSRLLGDRTRWSSSPNPCAPCTPAISAASGSS